MADTFLKQIADQMRDNPQAPALLSAGRLVGFGALGERVQAVLDILPATPDAAPVLIHGHKEPDVVAAMLACMFAGRCFVFVDRSNPPDRVVRIAGIAGARLALSADDSTTFAWNLPSNPQERPHEALQRRISLGELPGRPLCPDARREADPESRLYLIFTSGSTGEPKGVAVTRANFEAFHGWYGPMLQTMRGQEQAAATSAHVNHASLSFDMGMLDLWPVLALGRPVIMLDHRHNILPRKNIEAITVHPAIGARSWFSTPSLLQLMCTDPQFNGTRLPWLRCFFVGGEVVQRTLVHTLRERFPNSEIRHAYGPTEATCVTHVHVLSDADIASDTLLPLGPVIAPNTMRISDQDGREVPFGSPGEVVLCGPQIAQGYVPHNHPANRAFASQDGIRLYRTGDLGRLDESGNLILLGRVDRQVKWNGNRIELNEIERAANSLPQVHKAVCIAQCEDSRVIDILLFVQKQAGACFDPDTCGIALAKLLPLAMIPRDIRFVESLPLNVNGKVDEKALMAQDPAMAPLSA